MSNEEVYAGGLLARALNPASQPSSIREFLAREAEMVSAFVADGARIVDIGCGTGRHLAMLAPRLTLGVGVDYQLSYIRDARRRADHRSLHFVVADGTATPFEMPFDAAVCLTNTWGTMADKEGILHEMRRLAPQPGSRVLSVYAESSIDARRTWYANLGHDVVEATDEYLASAGGFRSEHFTETRVRRLLGACEVRPIGDIGYFVTT